MRSERGAAIGNGRSVGLEARAGLEHSGGGHGERAG
jgi:hypothetical protein